MAITYLSVYARSFANLRKAPMGSEPVDKTNTRGVVLDISAYNVGKSVGGLSTNCCPRFSLTKSVTAKITYSAKENIFYRIC